MFNDNRNSIRTLVSARLSIKPILLSAALVILFPLVTIAQDVSVDPLNLVIRTESDQRDSVSFQITNSGSNERVWNLIGLDDPFFADFQVVANASGPLDPHKGGAADFSGYPSLRPDSSQQLGAGQWMLGTGSTGLGGDYDAFLSRSIREGIDNVLPWDWEIRFTDACYSIWREAMDSGDPFATPEDGCYSYDRFSFSGDTRRILVPFEIWNVGIGTYDDTTDDYRAIPVVIDWDIDGFDLQWVDHLASGADNDPETDWVYWHNPCNASGCSEDDLSPGTGGYDRWLEDHTNGVQEDSHGTEVLARIVFFNWNGGSIAAASDKTDFLANIVNQEMPEPGTVFRIVTPKDFVRAEDRTGEVPTSSTSEVVLEIDPRFHEAGVYTKAFELSIAGLFFPMSVRLEIPGPSDVWNGPGDDTFALVEGADTLLAIRPGDNNGISELSATVFPNGAPPGMSNAVNRFYEITAVGGSYSAEATFYYSESELVGTGLTEEALQVYQWETDSVWTPIGGVLDTDRNAIDVAGLASFGVFAIGDPAVTTDVDDAVLEIEKELDLWHYPNPFSESTTIGFDTAHSGHVKIDLYDVTGRRVRSIIDLDVPAGGHAVTFERDQLASGVYFYRLQAGKKVITRQMVITR